MKTPAWPAPAKLNLFLRITGRNKDGYHSLQTLFQLLDYGDELCFSLREDERLRRLGNHAAIPEQDDLVIRAAQSLRKATAKRTPGVDIKINKRLPVGGGLGGGSSDAATTLVALNHLWGLSLGVDVLAAMGLNLGADVPVFVRGESAWAEGVGEQLRPLALPQDWFLVIDPGCRVSTGEVFKAADLTRDSAPITIADFFNGAGGNDCEAVVRNHHPQVGEALDWLAGQVGQADARMSGTGACVFAGFADEAAARALLAALPLRWRGFVARGRNRSPLLARLAREESKKALNGV